MKTNTKSIMLSVALCVSTAGCVSRDIEPLAGGFEEVTYTHTSWEHPQQRISFQYRRNGKRVMIWPSLFGTRPLIKDDLALFVGDQDYRQPPRNARATRERLFAVKASGPPLDITDEVLWRWSKKSGEDFSQVARKATITYPKEKDNGVVFYFASGPDVYLEWDQISDIMREVKEKGVVRKDQVWGATYIEKEFHVDDHK
jgi:hypothetical protein